MRYSGGRHRPSFSVVLDADHHTVALIMPRAVSDRLAKFQCN
jgi:hypothetical protein